jgi:hypothetical protein
MRDDFDKETKEVLARRVGSHCSNPKCKKLTSGPQVDPTKALNIGVAAHITAASPNGPRFDPNCTAEERKSANNGIWLCQNCAKLVDNDTQRYPADLLREWKIVAETAALVELEQQRVADLLIRPQGAELDLRVGAYGKLQPSVLNDDWIHIGLDIAVTSTNSIASDYGALKLTVARPMTIPITTVQTFGGGAPFESSVGLPVDGYDDIPHAMALTTRWGANAGNVIFPGHWHNFYNNPFFVDVPSLSLIPNPAYLFQVELFTLHSASKYSLYALQIAPQSPDFEICEVNCINHNQMAEQFWQTYHAALAKLRS